MLKIQLKTESHNSKDNTFSYETVKELSFEHSLVSLSKWEAKHEIPFLGDSERTDDQTLDYVKMMCLEELTEADLALMTRKDFEDLNAYITSKQTATWFTEEEQRRHSSQAITAEIIYYWMVALQIPFECQHWHLNRLITLIRVTNEKQTPPKKTSRADNMRRHASQNAARRAARKR